MIEVSLSGSSTPKLLFDYGIPATISTLCHPFVSARTLMMLGHEYEPPMLGRNLIGLKRYMYPNVFNYLRHMREDVGLFNVFMVGLPASLVGSAIKTTVCEFYLEQTVRGFRFKKSVIQTEEGFKVFLEETCKLTAGRCLGLIASYPFQVIMIRQIAQLVGNETIYNGILQAFIEINANEGVRGLFAGLLPRLMGEVIAVWLTAALSYVVNRYLMPDDADPKIREQTPYVASILVSSCTHRLTVTSTVMAVSGSRLTVDVPFKNSLDCYNYLSQRDAFVRGASFFFRYASGPL